MSALVELSGVDVDTPAGRPLIRGLTLSLSAGDHVAVIGRNGVGKSTLLEILAGGAPPARGTLTVRTRPALVRQDPDPAGALALVKHLHDRALGEPLFDRALTRELAEAGSRPLAHLLTADTLSPGEARKIRLAAATLARPELLLLDEPTQDMDAAGEAWLRRSLARWPGGLIVASHSRRVLQHFEHFFILAESGCRYVPGTFEALERQLEREDDDRQRQYVKNLNTLADKQRHHVKVCQRRARKKNVGRLHELGRRTSRARLNAKRSYAQESQGRAAKIREDRIEGVRGWAKATRRALAVKLPLESLAPRLPPDDGTELIALSGVGLELERGPLFADLDARIGRDRLAVTGPNGSGKTSLLGIMLGQFAPTTGAARCRLQRIGSIAQGASDWICDDSLITRLFDGSSSTSYHDVARLLIAHRFPLPLAERPLASLSPGERVRAALICLFHQTPTVELLVLDEPTFSLDFVGLAALRVTLASWPGGLVVASHDQDLLDAVGITQTIALDGRGGHRSSPDVQAHVSRANDRP